MEKLLEKIYSFRELSALKRLWGTLKALPLSIFNFKKFSALILVAAELIGMLLFQYPLTPRGQAINLDEWELTWSDEFDGDSLDTTKWRPSYSYVRRGGIWDKGQVSVHDGTLRITTEYLSDGPLGAGWYSEEISTKGLFEQQYGYFECKCICPGAKGLWAAFWMLSEGMFEPPTGSAANGCEIDLFESGFFGAKQKYRRNIVNQATGFDGYGEGSSGVIVGHYQGKNIYTEYNTYGLEWSKDELIFYINGVETDRLSGKWVPQVKEYLLLSVEVAGTNGETGIGGDGLPFAEENKNINNNDMSIFPIDFIVDYVRVYQRKGGTN
ncbi:MAG: glycoside hydrolase family 16 protein [Clostridiales bacterium]|nr:glycoside hydrolase family 16 protein [Clostridiales bacterium]